MRKLAAIALLSLPLAACEPTGSSIFLPMEPTQASIDARRRDLTDAEKDAITDAVMEKLQDKTHRDFRWAPLVLKSRDHLTVYCGLVSELELWPQTHESFRRYYAQLSFDRRGTLSNVDVVSVDEPGVRALPTVADSICIQGGYNISP